MSERKPDGERVNRNPRVYPTSWIIWDGAQRGPELPTDREWTDATREWWHMIRNSAQAMLMHDTDWSMLKIVAILYDQLHSLKGTIDKDGKYREIQPTPGEKKGLAGEIRTFLDPYGFTHQSRVKYGINIATPADLENEAIQEQIKSAPRVIDYRKEYGG